MEDYRVTAADLLTAWREATRAAELAARLATEAEAAAAEADDDVVANVELAKLAEAAAGAAEQAAENARHCAERARTRAAGLHGDRVPHAQQEARNAIAREDEARARYHQASRQPQDGARPA